MKPQLKNQTELFDYLMYGYSYALEDMYTQKGIQKRLKDNELEQELKNKTKENIKVKDLLVELKLGPSYNRTTSPWIQIYTPENKSGTKGRYVGISFIKERGEIELWIGFGRTAKKQSEVYELAKEYKIRYSLIEPTLKYGFEYKQDCHDAMFIKKKYEFRNFNEKEFERDLEYITELYKKYEIRFEQSSITLGARTILDSSLKEEMNYEELNRRMLSLIEEVGNLAQAIKELGKR